MSVYLGLIWYYMHGYVFKILFFNNKGNGYTSGETTPLNCFCLPSDLKGTALKGKYCITKTYLYNFDPLKPHFYIVKLGFTGVYIIFLISAQKHRTEAVLTSTHKLCFEILKISVFYLKFFRFWR